MSKEIGVMGPSDFVIGFNLAGIRRTYAIEREEFPKAVERLVAHPEGLGILIVPGEDIAALPPYLRKKVQDSLEPVVIAMGDAAGSGDLREKVKRAIGIDLYKD